MEIILLEKIKTLGALGEVVKVRPGYARNYLIPQGKALRADKANLAYFAQKKTELEQKYKQQHASNETRAQALQGLSLTLKARASDEGKLYGSVTATEIAQGLKALGHQVSRHEIQFSGHSIRQVGTHNVMINIAHGEFVLDLVVNIEAEQG